MTTLTPRGLVLLAPLKSAHDYFELWQLSSYSTFITHHPNALDSLAWLNFEAEDQES